MNGGYFINGVPYMDCKITGEPVRNVSTEAKSVIGSRAFIARMDKMFPEQNKPKREPTGRPAGWHWMSEFVDKDGNVFHKGKEQPELKGTLEPTKVKPRKKKKRDILLFLTITFFIRAHCQRHPRRLTSPGQCTRPASHLRRTNRVVARPVGSLCAPLRLGFRACAAVSGR